MSRINPKQAQHLDAFPSWTARVRKDNPGMSPLGLEAIGESMVAKYLLPGITNATLSPRYFSLLAWIVGTFAEHHRGNGSAKLQLRAFERWRGCLEQAWRLCSHYVTPDATGIIGARESRKVSLASSDVVPLSITAASAFELQNYGASFRGVGLAQWGEQGILELSPLGAELSNAFDLTLRDGLDRKQRLALEVLFTAPDQMDSILLRSLADRLRNRPINSNEAEYKPLLLALTNFGSGPEGHWQAIYSDQARSRGLALLLELYDQGDGQIKSPGQLHQIFATRLLPQGTRLRQMTSSLEETFSTWERYTERQQQKIAIAAFWHELLNYLKSNEPHSTPSELIVRRLCRLATDSQAVNSVAGGNSLALSYADFSAGVRAAFTPFQQQAPLEQWKLFTEIVDLTSDGPVAEERLGKAVYLLVLLTQSWKDVSSTLPASQFLMHRPDEAERLPLPWMQSDFIRHEADSMLEMVRWVIEWCIIGQSSRVAYDKLDQGDRFFIKRDESGYRRAEGVPERASYFNFDSDRLRGSTSLLVGMGLLKWNSGVISITAKGRALKNALALMKPLSETGLAIGDLEGLGDSIDDEYEAGDR